MQLAVVSGWDTAGSAGDKPLKMQGLSREPCTGAHGSGMRIPVSIRKPRAEVPSVFGDC